MEARMAQAKANRTLPFFLGSTASGSAAEAIAGGFLLCSLCCAENANGSVVLKAARFYVAGKTVQCSITWDAIYRQGRQAGSEHPQPAPPQEVSKRPTGKVHGPTRQSPLMWATMPAAPPVAFA